MTKRSYYFNCLLITLGVLGAIVGIWDTFNRLGQDSVVTVDELSHSHVDAPHINVTGVPSGQQMEQVFSSSLNVTNVDRLNNTVNDSLQSNFSLEGKAVKDVVNIATNISTTEAAENSSHVSFKKLEKVDKASQVRLPPNNATKVKNTNITTSTNDTLKNQHVRSKRKLS